MMEKCDLFDAAMAKIKSEGIDWLRAAETCEYIAERRTGSEREECLKDAAYCRRMAEEIRH